MRNIKNNTNHTLTLYVFYLYGKNEVHNFILCIF